MYKNPLLNNSIYDSESCSRSNNYSNVVRGDNEVFFANAKVNVNARKVTNCVSKSKMNFNRKQQHQQQLPYHSLLTHTHSHMHTLSKNKSAVTTTTTHKHPTITKTIFTKLSENIYKSINTNINTNIYNSTTTTTNNTNTKFSFNYDDFINENTLSSFHNKLTNPLKNKKIIQSFIERSTSRQKKVTTCSRNKYCGSFGPNVKQKKKTTHHCNSSRTPEQFYTEQKQFLEKKENNIAMLKNNIQSVENLIVQDKPTISANTVNIALKKQKCKDVYIRLYKKKHSSDKDMCDILKESTLQKAYTSNNNSNSNSNILHQPHSISNSVYIRLTSRNNSSRTYTYKTPKSTSNEKSTSLRKAKSPALTSNESLCILLDKFLTSFELCLTNICNCTLRSVSSSSSSSHGVALINKEQLNNILNKLHCTQGNNVLLESTWKELVVKSNTYNNSTQMVSLQYVLLFLLSVLGFLREYTSNNSKSLPKYVSSRLNGVIGIDDVKTFETKGQNVSQINITFQEMRNNYFNSNFYASKDSTTTNTPEHVSHKPKTKHPHKQCVISLYDTYKHTKALKEQQLNDKRKLNLQKELSLCTFTPDLSLTNKQNISLCNNISITSRLYTDVHKKQQQQRIDNTRVCNNDNMCLLKQTHHSRLNHEMFIKNPLQNDRSVITKCEMMKQARCEQKKKNYYFQRGEPCKNEDHCYCHHSYRKYCNTLYSTSDFEIAVDINSAEDVKRKGKVVDVKSFVIKKGENAIGKINEFCRKYGLNEDSKEQIIMEVKDKIETAT